MRQAGQQLRLDAVYHCGVFFRRQKFGLDALLLCGISKEHHDFLGCAPFVCNENNAPNHSQGFLRLLHKDAPVSKKDRLSVAENPRKQAILAVRFFWCDEADHLSHTTPLVPSSRSTAERPD